MNHYITLAAGKENKKHYENFPVATFLYPKRIREAAIILYQFARTGDDIADEGLFSTKERLEKLEIYQKNLNRIKNNNINVDPLFQDIYKIIKNYSIPLPLFQKFINAFKQDIINKRYKNFNEVSNYLNNAASPAGEMILCLFNMNTDQNIKYSNSICHALALIGISQDLHEDILKNRLYIPSDEMKKFNLKKSDIQNKEFNNNWKTYKLFWLNRTGMILEEGLPLLNNTKGRFKLQIKIMINASKLLIQRMENNHCDLFNKPPKLSKIDWIYLFFKALY